jgi:hypothetical protein
MCSNRLTGYSLLQKLHGVLIHTKTRNALRVSPADENDYVTERNKPLPNRMHGVIQSKLSVLLSQCGKRYQLQNEVT